MNENPQLEYADYLQLEKLLNAQRLRSIEYNRVSHHEHLFIITHQVYELWFKQILFELDSLGNLFSIDKMDKNPFELIKRLRRIIMILKLLIDQFPILETMTSVDFFEFRDFLYPASGGQSLQFRLIENKLGLAKDALQGEGISKLQWFDDEMAKQALVESQSRPSLFTLVQNWLENIPWKKINYLEFRDSYRKGLNKFIQNELDQINNEKQPNKKTKLDERKKLYESLFDDELHSALVRQKSRRFSQKALLGAISVYIYQNEYGFGPYFEILNLISEVDSHFIKWRYCHMLVVQKMIGWQNAGTGGSTGYRYLQSTTRDDYKIFIDLASLPIFFIPRQFLPSFEKIRSVDI